MRTILRGMGIILLFALFISPTTLLSQDDDTINVIGSRIVTDVFDAIVEALPTELENEISISPSGTTTGFEGFCQGIADITGATRPISVDEEALCIQNGVQFSEYLLGYDAVAVITHPNLEALTCLSTFELNDLFAPSAEGVITDWSQTAIAPEGITDPVSLYLPPDDTTTYVLMDDLVEGLSLRRDVTTEADSAALIEAVGNTPGAVGVVNLSALGDDAPVNIVELTNPELGSCFAPTTEAIELRQYPAANRLLIYVNQNNLEKPGLRDVLNFAISDDSATIVDNAGLVTPSENTYALNQAILTGDEEAGRQFSLEVVSFQIPPSVIGTVNIGGSSNLYNFANQAGTQFNAEYPGVTVNVDISGETSGLRQFCNGEINILTADEELPDFSQTVEELREIFRADNPEVTAEPEITPEAEVTPDAEVTAEPAPTTPFDTMMLAAQNCNANNVTPYTIDLGKRAVVLVAHASSDYLTCLSNEQVLTIWQSASTDTVMNWNDVDSNLPEEEIFLFSPAPGQGNADLLLTPAQGNVLPIRLDVTEQNDDPLYRAAAVANAPGGSLTFMAWQDYQEVLENGQENIQLVAVDGSEGCVTPSEETIRDGSYPLTESNYLIVDRDSLLRQEIQSILWYLFSDASFSLIENAQLVGLTFGDLPALRDELQNVYADVTAEAAIPPEVMPELTETPAPAESTIEPEATAEATPETESGE